MIPFNIRKKMILGTIILNVKIVLQHISIERKNKQTKKNHKGK